ncbi:hypothetical protein HDR58_05180 [bacterium]|nr:hypothetical protein [bacterium]
MNVNFTGIKNVGYEFRKYREAVYDDGSFEFLDPDEDMDKDEYDEDIQDHYLTVQLTDDFQGKDLTEFHNCAKRSGLKDYLHPENPDLLSFSITKTDFTDDYSKPEILFYLNDYLEELEVKDENMPMFTFLAKVLQKVVNKKNSEFIVDKSYIDNKAATSIILGDDLREGYGDQYNKIMKQVHSPETVKSGANEMLDVLTDRMIDYFS